MAKLEGWDNPPIIPPPQSVEVPSPDKRPVLYTANGKPLVKPPIGFKMTRSN